MTTAPTRRRDLLLKAPALTLPAWPESWWPSRQPGPAQPSRLGPVKASLGINLGSMEDWNTEFAFVDMFRSSRPWISQRNNAPWGTGPKLQLDAAGWVQSLEPDCFAETPMCSDGMGVHPAGRYTVTYDGKGELEFWGSANLINHATGSSNIEVTPKNGPLWLRIRKTDPSNPIRNIRVLRPGVTPAAAHNQFHDAFLERWRGVTCIRFMDWMHTNNSQVRTWAERPKPTDATFMARGVAAEVMIDLANRLEADPWFCMPHQADEGYITEFAQLVKARLAPHLKAYVEYSNEVWNGQFEQARYAQGRASAAGLTPHTFTAARSMQIFGTWEKVFGGLDRLVRVMPSQAPNSWLSEQMLKYKDTAKRCDVLAIAPYFGIGVTPSGPSPNAPEVERWSLDMLMDHLETKVMPECVGWMKSQKALADRFGLKLVAYEGGQHLLGILGAENNERLTDLMLAANAHPRMGTLYRRYFDAWTAAGGDLHCHFNTTSNWSKWGSWGLLRHAGEDPAKSPKFMATMSWARQQGQKVRVPG